MKSQLFALHVGAYAGQWPGGDAIQPLQGASLLQIEDLRGGALARRPLFIRHCRRRFPYNTLKRLSPCTQGGIAGPEKCFGGREQQLQGWNAVTQLPRNTRTWDSPPPGYSRLVLQPAPQLMSPAATHPVNPSGYIIS